MDENRLERLGKLINQIEPAEDVKERILENVVYRKQRKISKALKYVAAAVVIFVCACVLYPEFSKNNGSQSSLVVYASELNEDNWRVLPPGEKRMLSDSVETNWGYEFKLEIPDEAGYTYTLSNGTSIGIDWVYFYNNVIGWHVHNDSEYDFPEHMESDIVIYVADSEGNKIGRWRLVLSREGDSRFAELVDESDKIEN